MPREVILLCAEAPSSLALVEAGADIAPDLRVRTLDRVVTEIVDDRGSAVLSVQEPERIDNAAEIARLAPWATLGAPVWWTEAWAPWGPAGDVGIAVVRSFAAAIDAQCSIADGS
ncbi:hypothetical protein [Curtobacterium aurantiacum]|uniref:hypothetical protein n=1 Tax=Curtobacterium aurantiacum TaxID=3236919 RepID=UPI001BDE3CFE|nr:hypothetical protein [Curtobacterium flaccumfaciens]MBT1678094.1 hypothetical protein [Curtobacterium flaccumfaciens pv. flaccumfaciens]